MSDDETTQNVIHINFKQGIRSGGGAPEHKSPVGTHGAPRAEDPTEGLYSVQDVAKLFSYKASRIRYWDRSGLLSPSIELDGHRYYTFQDLIGLRAAKGLLDEGVGLREVRRTVESLREKLPSMTRPLSELRVVADGKSIVVHDEAGAYEASTGQTVIDFRVNALHADVIRLLHVTEDARKTAYEYYLDACQLDEDDATMDRAEALYRKALTLDPGLSNAFTNLGNLCYRRAQIDQAERYYREALEIDPSQPEAQYDLGLIHFERGELDQAIERFVVALDNDPSFADAHFNIAMALEQSGRSNDARAHWQMYVRIEPVGPWTDIAQEHLRGLV